MSPALLLLSAVLLPLLGAAVAPFVGRRLGARAGWLLSPVFLPGLALLSQVNAAKTGQPVEVSLAWVPAIDLALGLRADGFSILFALIVAGIGTLILLYAAAYLGPRQRHGRFYSYLLLFGGAMMGLVLADNLIALFAFWELTSISSFLLIGFWDYRKASQDGAVKALLITAGGGLALLAGVIFLALAGDTVLLSELDPELVRASPYFVPAALMLLLAAFSKSAQLPFHLWLPTAMEAPTPVSAYLHSATMVKAGVVLIAKFGFLFEATSFSVIIMYVGLATMFWGSYLALRQSDLKALLAYSTVSQLGIMMSLYGAGYPFAATAHLINHAVFKATLFMVTGIIDHETGSRNIDRLSGLWRKLPLSFVLAVLAALSMAGLPPLGGFISKELFYESMLHEGFWPIFIAVSGSIMTFAYSLRFLKVFVGPLRSERPEVHEAPAGFWLPVLPLGLATLAFGLWPLQLGGNPFTSTTVASWFTDLAAPALNYEAGKLYVWHGPTIALSLSVLTWFAGFALHLIREPFASLQERLEPGWNVNTLYYRSIGGLERSSRWLTSVTQEASFATHLRLLWLPVALLGAWAGWRFWPTTLSPVPLEFWIVSFLITAGCIGVLIAHNRLNALIFMGLAGFASVFVFVLLRAPDLALTQLLIETVTVILFLGVFRYLPFLKRYVRDRSAVVGDALLSTGVGMSVFTVLVAVQSPIAPRIKDFFLENSKPLGGGKNVVNVILVDFRGYDTMGEITVLGIVAVSVYALLKLKTRIPFDEDEHG